MRLWVRVRARVRVRLWVRVRVRVRMRVRARVRVWVGVAWLHSDAVEQRAVRGARLGIGVGLG